MTSPRDPWFFQRWAWDTTVGSVAGKACLAFLAKCADSQTGRCEAKQATIAHGIEAAERTVREHLATLEGMGLIARRPQFRIDRGRRNDEFLLLAPGVTAWPDGQRVDVHVAESAGGPGAAGREEPAAPGGTPRGVSRPPRRNGHRGTTTRNDAAAGPVDDGEQRDAAERTPPATGVGDRRRATTDAGAPPDAADAVVPANGAGTDPLQSALERLEPFVASGRLHPPRADGGDAVLADALRQHGADVVAAALDHVVAWAGSPDPLRSPHLSRLLPTALSKARRSARPGGGAATRESWERVRSTLRTTVATHRNQLDALTALAADVGVATLVVRAGWDDVVAVARGVDAFETRQAASRVRRVWEDLTPDAAAVERHLADLDARIAAHCRRAGIDRADLGIRTPARRPDGRP